ncbi:MAG: YkgJ family cysteine cluster protein [Methylococcaceae bacterium]|nr:YkgJ family cysteine cluster protein [Methylococcaceae bacterium]
MKCRQACGACCIAPSISSAIPGMPKGKPAGLPCIQLDEQLRCRIFGSAARPLCCAGLQPSAEMCGADRSQALEILTELERLTRPCDPQGSTE